MIKGEVARGYLTLFGGTKSGTSGAKIKIQRKHKIPSQNPIYNTTDTSVGTPKVIFGHFAVEDNLWLHLEKSFLDAPASLDFKLSVAESVSNLPIFFFFKYLVNQVMQVTKLIQVICESTFKSFRFVQRAEKLCYPRFST